MRILLLLCVLPLFAERITIPLRDPSRPALIKLSRVNGSVTVRAHSGKEVLIDTEESAPRTRPASNGMKQILTGMKDLTVEEENNVVSIRPHPSSGGTLVVLVPEKSSVQLRTVNAHELRVEGIEGEINAETVNGSIVIADAGGPIVAHAQNGRLTATLKRVVEGKPMSFSTLNGRIDVTLPASTKADLKLQNQHGETYSDFDLQISMSVNRTESGRENGPKYRLNMERIVTGKINGGGPEITFRSMNGSIYVRKGN